MVMDKEKLLILTKDRDKENGISDRGNEENAVSQVQQNFQSFCSILIPIPLIKILYPCLLNYSQSLSNHKLFVSITASYALLCLFLFSKWI